MYKKLILLIACLTAPIYADFTVTKQVSANGQETTYIRIMDTGSWIAIKETLKPKDNPIYTIKVHSAQTKKTLEDETNEYPDQLDTLINQYEEQQEKLAAKAALEERKVKKAVV